MSQKIPTIKVRVLRAFYYLDPLPNETWSRTPTPKPAGTTILMKLKDAIEARSNGKVAFIKAEAAAPAPAPPIKMERTVEEKRKDK